MPLLVDGNNLLHAAWKHDPERLASRSTLCVLLGTWSQRFRDPVHVVFDGPSPTAARREQIGHPDISMTFSGAVSADAVIIRELETHSAARRLTVVSSDREIRAAARRRRASSVASEEFWARLVARLAQEPGQPLEPREKRAGLGDEQMDVWLREFGLDDGGGPDEADK